ncbi:MAG: hypothetical protein ABSE51_08185 [Terracidiphilus sp.]|jgi:uncharacterized membrane protein HdeD (DUF308 family)
MIKEGWFFLVAGIIAVVSSVFDKKKLKLTAQARLVSGLVGTASFFYGWFLLRHGEAIIKEGWFFLVGGTIAVISSAFDKKSPMVNDADGSVSDEDKEKLKTTVRARLIYGFAGSASFFYGWFLLRH